MPYSYARHLFDGRTQVDPLRGKTKPNETPFQAACREFKEESCNVLEIDPEQISLDMQERAFIEGDKGSGLYHFRAVLETKADVFQAMVAAFTSNSCDDVWPG